MLVRFAYQKLIRPNQSTLTGAFTTYVESRSSQFSPLGGTAVATAPSTLIIDEKGNQFHSPKPFSAVHAALTAVTSTDAAVNLI
jgi:hypothetical protein